MRIAIRNTTIVTADAARTIHHDATLVIDGDRIAAIDPTNRTASQPATDVIDGRGKAVFPGLSNCHTHLHLTHSRGIQEDFGFPSSLRFPSTVAAFMSQEELGVFAALGATEAIRSGTTGLIEIGFLKFNRSSQHRTERGCDDDTKKAFGTGRTSETTLARPALGSAA